MASNSNLSMESNSNLTSLTETLNINKFRYRVEFGTIEDHNIRTSKFFHEAGIVLVNGSFHHTIVDHKKFMLAKIKYGI